MARMKASTLDAVASIAAERDAAIAERDAAMAQRDSLASEVLALRQEVTTLRARLAADVGTGHGLTDAIIQRIATEIGKTAVVAAVESLRATRDVAVAKARQAADAADLATAGKSSAGEFGLAKRMLGAMSKKSEPEAEV